MLAITLKNYINTAIGYRIKRYRPFFLFFRITYRCNLKCLYCGLWKRKSEEVSTSDFPRILQQLKEIGIGHIGITGGEPLLRKDIEVFSSQARAIGIMTSLSTNGMLIDKRRAESLCNSFDNIKVSLDGFEKTHDKLRNKKNAYRKAVKGLKNLLAVSDRKAKIGVQFTLTDLNYKEIENFIVMLKGLGVDFMWINPIGVNTNKLYRPISSEVFEKVIKLLNSHRDFLVETPSFFSEKLYTAMKCYAGKLSFSLEPNGDVLTCPLYVNESKLCNILRDNIKKIWKSQKFKEKMKFLEENCKANCYSRCTLYPAFFFEKIEPKLLFRYFNLFVKKNLFN